MTMTDTQIGELLARVTALDPHRDIGITTAATWADVFAGVDITFDQAYAGLLACAKTTPAGFIGPNEIIAAAGRTPARDRERLLLAKAGSPQPPSGLDQRQEREWIHRRCDAVKAGHEAGQADAMASWGMRLPPAAPAITGPAVAEQVKLYRELAARLGSDRPTSSSR